jgi:hypothetical protein
MITVALGRAETTPIDLDIDLDIEEKDRSLQQYGQIIIIPDPIVIPGPIVIPTLPPFSFPPIDCDCISESDCACGWVILFGKPSQMRRLVL